MNNFCAKFGEFSFSHFGFIVRTDTQTESQRRINARLKAGFHSNARNARKVLRKKNTQAK